jgi:hypothetical protein
MKRVDDPLTVKFVLQWEGDIELNLMLAAQSNDKSCVAGGI